MKPAPESRKFFLAMRHQLSIAIQRFSRSKGLMTIPNQCRDEKLRRVAHPFQQIMSRELLFKPG
jgi:hypothetical protein